MEIEDPDDEITEIWFEYAGRKIAVNFEGVFFRSDERTGVPGDDLTISASDAAQIYAGLLEAEKVRDIAQTLFSDISHDVHIGY